MTEVEKHVNNEILRNAVSLAMFCGRAKCQRSLDYRKAVLVESTVINYPGAVICAQCWAEYEARFPDKVKSLKVTRYEK
jgi:hypothetical protein